MKNEVNQNSDKTPTTKRPPQKPDKGEDKIRPDEGQGSKGNVGDDGDWGKHNDDLKRKQREASPIPIKEAK
jgi:hypothetical protein